MVVSRPAAGCCAVIAPNAVCARAEGQRTLVLTLSVDGPQYSPAPAPPVAPIRRRRRREPRSIVDPPRGSERDRLEVCRCRKSGFGQTRCDARLGPYVSIRPTSCSSLRAYRRLTVVSLNALATSSWTLPACPLSSHERVRSPDPVHVAVSTETPSACVEEAARVLRPRPGLKSLSPWRPVWQVEVRSR